ncbi:S-adenosyl-L-methionine-dependent methyltransferase [Ophiobolus disseminans]|uniref:DNA (cytosine-5-)-methyltransferase n=1 Tax=Ophiobolus disseminans TaxID=1469910 RepID=A0A6A6ZGZ1_9PLEO|nr:S-adenosyl-L-methionine-dependent methyltransferase [Ophiobolus disseminans]
MEDPAWSYARLQRICRKTRDLDRRYGFLCVGNVKCYVQCVPIQDLSVEGYGDSESPSIVTYVQSELAQKDVHYDVWFRLDRPSQEYKRFHDPFLWVAQLGKHVLDFIEERPARSVGLNTFRNDFHMWLTSRYPHNLPLQLWHQAYRGRVDFRTGIHAYIDFFYHQAFNLPNAKQLLAHPVWAECMVRRMTAIKVQDQVVQDTLATPDVYDCFKNMYFGSRIRAMTPSPPVKALQEARKSQLRFPKCQIATEQEVVSRSNPPCRPYNGAPIQVGDVVAFDPTDADRKFWGSTNLQWFAYIQRTEPRLGGVQRLFVLYLYCPRETNIFKAKYPFENELFFSDNCNCTEGELLSTDINGRCEVEWMPSTIPTKRFFVRQCYVTQDSAFAKMSPGKDYQAGDTVYITKTVKGDKISEPVVLRHVDRTSDTITVRKLLRLGRDCAHLVPTSHRATKVAANELVLTDEYETISATRLQRRCQVRFVTKKDLLLNQIPFPYSLGGAGDLWIISMGLSTSNNKQRLMYLSRLPERFNEGPDLSPSQPSQKLKGLSIFSGGGSLDRGLQEGGAVDFQTVVDFSAEAMHTQRANTDDPSRVRFFCGSVDDYLKAVLNGKQHEFIALIGAVNFIAAGSPCPGFSTLQQNFLSEGSIRNASHISTFLSFVDLYRPEYAVLENVVSMASTRTGYEDENVLSQLVACLVSMGYQVNQYIMDAWSYGSAQHRSRVFLTIAAPGLDPIIQPWHTHSRPYQDTVGKSLGRLPNGQRFGERERYATPFAHLSAGAVTSDLPNIGNGNVQSCVPHPDHRVAYQPGRKDRALLQCIPRYPPGVGYKEAFGLGLIPPSLLKSGKETGKAYQRIKEAGLVPTITTGQTIQDSRNGAVVHWSQDRPITILEARRTQGWPDEEPIIGSLVEQYKIVGNGVDRKVAFALGLALRQVVEQKRERSRAEIRPKGPVEEMLVDAEEDLDDTDSVGSKSSNIHVYVPPQSQTTGEPRTSRPIFDPPLPDADSYTAEIFDILGFDGTSTARDDELHFSTPTATSTALTGPSLLSRLSASVVNGPGALSFRAKPSNPASLPVSGKRSREEELDDAVCGVSDKDSDAMVARKRARIGNTPRTDSPSKGTIGVTDGPATPRVMGRKKRSTRHSGLEVTFEPKQWDKRPEQEHNKKK